MNEFLKELNSSLLDEKELLIEQRVKSLEVLAPIEQKNHYEILSSFGKNLGTIEEEKQGFKGDLLRNVMTHWRAFKFQIFDTNLKLFLKFERISHHPFSSVKVFGENNNYLGFIKRPFSFLYKKYVLYDSSGRPFSVVRSPLWKLWSFPISNLQGKQIGAIQKKWVGLLQEASTNADNFKIEFPENLSFEQKAVVLVASITIDFNHFERRSY